MKQAIKVIVISIVIVGLLAAYGLSGIFTGQGQNQQGPHTEPTATGPTENPPR